MIITKNELQLATGDKINHLDYSSAHSLVGTAVSGSFEGVTVRAVTSSDAALLANTYTSKDVTCLKWHPVEPVLAVGLANGGIVLFAPKTGATSPTFAAHKAPIHTLRWGDNGARLLSVDTVGGAVVWECPPAPAAAAAAALALTRLHTLSLPATPARTVLRAYDQTGLAPDVADDGRARVQWVVLCVGGTLCLVDDLGTLASTPVGDAATAVALLYWPANDQLIVITQSSLLARFTFVSGGLAQGPRAALALAGRAPSAAGWAGAGVVAVAAGDSVRMFDLASMSAYTLPHPIAEDDLPSLAPTETPVSPRWHHPSAGASPVHTICYCPVRHILLTASSEQLAAWVCAAPLPHRAAPSDWAPAGRWDLTGTGAGAGAEVGVVLPLVSGPAFVYAGAKMLVLRPAPAAAAADPVSGLAVEQVAAQTLLVTAGAARRGLVKVASAGSDVLAVAGTTLLVGAGKGGVLYDVSVSNDAVVCTQCATVSYSREIRGAASARVQAAATTTTTGANKAPTPVELSTLRSFFALAVGNSIEVLTPAGRPVLKLRLPDHPGAVVPAGRTKAHVTAVAANGPWVAAADSRGVVAAWTLVLDGAGVLAARPAWTGLPPLVAPTEAAYRVEKLAVSSNGAHVAFCVSQLLDGGDRVGAPFAGVVPTGGSRSEEPTEIVCVESATPSHMPSSVLFDAHWQTLAGSCANIGEPSLLVVVESPVIEDNIDDADSLTLPPGTSALGAAAPTAAPAIVTCAPIATTAFVAPDGSGAAVHQRVRLVPAVPAEAPATQPAPPLACLAAPSLLTGTGEAINVLDVSAGGTGVAGETFDVALALRQSTLSFTRRLAFGDVDAALADAETASRLRPGAAAPLWRALTTLCIRSGRFAPAMHCMVRLDQPFAFVAMREAVRAQLAYTAANTAVQHGPLFLPGMNEAAEASETAQAVGRAALADLAFTLGMTEVSAAMLAADGEHATVAEQKAALGDWEGATQHLRRHAPSGMPALHYLHGRHLETLGDVGSAVVEFADTPDPVSEVPRLLVASGREHELETFVNDAPADQAPAMHLWNARYAESVGDREAAAAAYTAAGEAAELVLMAAGESINAAQAAVSKFRPGSRQAQQASLALARVLEADGQLAAAARRYAAAGCASYAARLTMDDADANAESVFRVAATLPLLGPDGAPDADAARTVAEGAAWLTARGEHGRAATLALRVGAVEQALASLEACQSSAERGDVCAALKAAAGETPLPGTTKTALAQLARWLVGEGEALLAAVTLAHAGEHRRALAVVSKYSPTLAQKDAELLVPPKDTPERAELLLILGQACVSSGLHELAAKCLAQGGDLTGAARALVQGGDWRKIMMFASTCRNKEVYVIAANFLQLVPPSTPQNNATINKAVQTFYVQAGAFTQLLRYYSDASDREVTANHDYAAALAAAALARRVAPRCDLAVPGAAAAVTEVEARYAALERFEQARAAVSSDPQTALAACTGLLADSAALQYVRPGDVHAMLVELFVARRMFERAAQHLDAISRIGSLSDYVHDAAVVAVQRATGYQPARAPATPQVSAAQQEEEEDLDIELSDF